MNVLDRVIVVEVGHDGKVNCWACRDLDDYRNTACLAMSKPELKEADLDVVKVHAADRLAYYAVFEGVLKAKDAIDNGSVPTTALEAVAGKVSQLLRTQTALNNRGPQC